MRSLAGIGFIGIRVYAAPPDLFGGPLLVPSEKAILSIIVRITPILLSKQTFLNLAASEILWTPETLLKVLKPCELVPEPILISPIEVNLELDPYLFGVGLALVRDPFLLRRVGGLRFSGLNIKGKL